MRIAGAGHVIFAAIIIALGFLGLINSNFAAVWEPIPVGVPGHEVLSYLCGFLSLACGLGLLWKSVVVFAARLLLIYLLLWSLLMNVPDIYRAHATLGSWYGLIEASMMVSAAWLLYASFAANSDGQESGFATGDKGVRIARVLYGSALIYLGVGHMAFLKETVADVPVWLPGRVGWAYFTGLTFIAAGLAVLVGVYARFAAALSTVQIALFVLLVWAPIIAAAGPNTVFEWRETIISAALAAGAWVVADSYRGMDWLALKSTSASTSRGLGHGCTPPGDNTLRGR